MVQEFEPVVIGRYSPDITEVSQIGYIDLREAYATGVVPADLSGDEPSYNGIDDPNSIIGRPDDVFSAMRANEFYAQSVKNSAPSDLSPGTGDDA